MDDFDDLLKVMNTPELTNFSIWFREMNGRYQLDKSEFAEVNQMEFIKVTKENLGKEHICCAISNNKDIQVSSKKAWLADRFDDGLVFLKSVERGKAL